MKTISKHNQKNQEINKKNKKTAKTDKKSYNNVLIKELESNILAELAKGMDKDETIRNVQTIIRTIRFILPQESPSFVKVPTEIIQWQTYLTAYQFSLLVYTVSRIHKKRGYAFFSLKRASSDTNICVNVLRKEFSLLQNLDLLYIDKRYKNHRYYLRDTIDVNIALVKKCLPIIYAKKLQTVLDNENIAYKTTSQIAILNYIKGSSDESIDAHAMGTKQKDLNRFIESHTNSCVVSSFDKKQQQPVAIDLNKATEQEQQQPAAFNLNKATEQEQPAIANTRGDYKQRVAIDLKKATKQEQHTIVNARGDYKQRVAIDLKKATKQEQHTIVNARGDYKQQPAAFNLNKATEQEQQQPAAFNLNKATEQEQQQPAAFNLNKATEQEQQQPAAFNLNKATEQEQQQPAAIDLKKATEQEQHTIVNARGDYKQRVALNTRREIVTRALVDEGIHEARARRIAGKVPANIDIHRYIEFVYKNLIKANSIRNKPGLLIYSIENMYYQEYLKFKEQATKRQESQIINKMQTDKENDIKKIINSYVEKSWQSLCEQEKAIIREQTKKEYDYIKDFALKDETIEIFYQEHYKSTLLPKHILDIMRNREFSNSELINLEEYALELSTAYA